MFNKKRIEKTKKYIKIKKYRVRFEAKEIYEDKSFNVVERLFDFDDKKGSRRSY